MMGKQGAKIIVSGRGNITADVIAVGYKARAQKTVEMAGAALDEKGLIEAHAKLDELMTALKQHGDELADPQPLFGLAERIAGEISRDKPDKLTLKSFLGTIAEEAKSVGEIAAAALSLKDIVAGLF
jgi:hypothetical protein